MAVQERFISNIEKELKGQQIITPKSISEETKYSIGLLGGNLNSFRDLDSLVVPTKSEYPVSKQQKTKKRNKNAKKIKKAGKSDKRSIKKGGKSGKCCKSSLKGGKKPKDSKKKAKIESSDEFLF